MIGRKFEQLSTNKIYEITEKVKQYGIVSYRGLCEDGNTLFLYWDDRDVGGIFNLGNQKRWEEVRNGFWEEYE